MAPLRARVLAAVVALVASFALDACSSPAPSAGAPVSATLHDFRITLGTDHVAAGLVTFHLDNQGPSTHEFNVDRLLEGTPTTTAQGQPDALPPDLAAAGMTLRADGLSVNEDSSALDRAGSLDTVDLGARPTLRLQLQPGTYVLYCNLEGHFLGGMHAVLTVG